MSDWRSKVVEKQPLGFVTLNANETGAMVIKSKKGSETPMYIQSEKDVLTYVDKPSAVYPDVFELIAFTREAPCWVSCAIGDNALYGGVDVLSSSVVGFGVGRDYSTYDYSTIERTSTYSAGNGDGVITTYTGTLPNVPITNPVTSFSVSVNGVTKTIVSDASGTLTGADVTAGTINLSTGAYSIQFSGTVGEYATVTSTIDLSTPIDLSGGATDKLCAITIDGVTQDVNFGQSATTSQTDVINAINAVFPTVATTSTNYVIVTGKRGSTLGNVTIDDPSTGTSALTLLFNATALTDTGVNPIGAIPGYNEAIVLSYNYSIDNTTVSHSFFTTSPYEDDLSAYVLSNGGSKFTLYLFQKNDDGNYASINSYSYSLIREKDSFQNSLYYEDVFRNNAYVQLKVNANYAGTAYSITSTTQVLFSGGSRGDDPQASDYLSSWSNFQNASKYRAQIFMDTTGNSATTLNTLVQTYQPWAQALSVVPYGNTPSEAITYRSGLGIDSDDICLYHNWTRIQDDYNNSSAWISNAGSVGKKWAQCAPAYDAASPAGVDADGYGGQLNDWRVLEVENDYTEFEGGETQQLDEAQINPIKFDDLYGLIIDGDRTLQVTNNDTSFVGTRRVYKLIIENIKRQVMRQQQFKLNDSFRQLKARTLCNSLIRPILAASWIREFQVVCDSSNNTDDVLGRREFVIDVYIKVTPNSQRVRLNFIRLSQSQTIASINPA